MPIQMRIVNLAAAALFACIQAPAAADSDAPQPAFRPYKVQLGAGFAAPYNMEEPFIDIAKTRNAYWSFEMRGGEDVNARRALDEGMIDPVSYLPRNSPSSLKYVSAGAFLSGADAFQNYYADTYVLDWKGDGDGYMQRWDRRAEKSRNRNSVTYALTPPQVTHATLRFSRYGDDLSDIRLYRKKYAALLERGEIWNPEFVKFSSRYDIIRTMDLQGTNSSLIRSYDQIAKMDEPWGQRGRVSWPEPPFFSIPYEALFALGVKTNAEIWLTIPPQIGAPISAADPSLRMASKPNRIDQKKLIQTTKAHAKETLAGPQWSKFAKEFVDRYLESGYPLERPLYVELGNEIWNYAAGFTTSTNYAQGIAQAFDEKWQTGHGYGVLSARWMIALEDELAARGIAPNIVYVLARHTANPRRTQQTFDGFKAYAVASGKDPATMVAKTAVALTNYYGRFSTLSKAIVGTEAETEIVAAWEAAIKSDPEGLRRKISSFLLDSAPSVRGSAAWVVNNWAAHKKIAEDNGSRLLGAYEGGSHLVVPKPLLKSKVFTDWWIAYHWGPEGADVARTVNQRLIAAFPGAVIANYASIGELRADKPWNDGHYARRTPMMDAWDELARP